MLKAGELLRLDISKHRLKIRFPTGPVQTYNFNSFAFPSESLTAVPQHFLRAEVDCTSAFDRPTTEVSVTTRAKFRLSTPTFGITAKDGKMRPILVPKASIIEVLDLQETQRMVNVDWDGVLIRLFAQDIQERGELLQYFTAANG